MAYIVSYGLLIIAVFCSYNLAKEKVQNKFIWPILTAILGPAIFIIQYLVTIFMKKKLV
ncbi:hypothetical protein [uncultured Clostridium sp.]|uniref:hypothetical protein n=1 Tax=uncultured Clostridium sp. TaxID=59620 RepID=UPI002635F434|nr:hypothetical protein [uncultured Clostridium sp.]